MITFQEMQIMIDKIQVKLIDVSDNINEIQDIFRQRYETYQSSHVKKGLSKDILDAPLIKFCPTIVQTLECQHITLMILLLELCCPYVIMFTSIDLNLYFNCQPNIELLKLHVMLVFLCHDFIKNPENILLLCFKF